MDSELKKLKKLAKFCRENGVSRFKGENVELELHPIALKVKAAPISSSAKRLPFEPPGNMDFLPPLEMPGGGA